MSYTRLLAALMLVAGLPAWTAAQPPEPAKPPSAAVDAAELRVFLDCESQCDFDYLRREITFVSHVRDRQSADVHVLVTTETTGGGGMRWKLQFIGLGRLKGLDDSITFTTAQTDSDDTRRATLARWLRLVLVRHAAAVHAHADLDVAHPEHTDPAAPAAAPDPWNAWVFNVSVSGNIDGEASSKSNDQRLNLSASRVTEAWRIAIGSSASRNTNRFELSDGSTVKSLTRSWDANALVVKSLGPHWSAGARTALNGSTFSNYDLNARVLAGIEYDIFPYAESTRRSLAIMYMAGVAHYDFEVATIFDRLRESHPEHTFGASLGLRQPWGSLGVETQFSQFLDDPGANRFNTFGNADVRLFRGFSFDVYGSYSRIRDQINLRKGAATPEEVLLRQRQLATGYSYWVGFGISYRFGSIYNNVVNPRFRSFF